LADKVDTPDKRVIRIQAGRESSLYLPEGKELESSLFLPLFRRADTQLKEITDMSDNYINKNPAQKQYMRDKPYEAPHITHIPSYGANVIAFCGDRGQGKSSAMLAYAKYLEKLSADCSPECRPSDTSLYLDTNPRKMSYCVMGRINPQQLEEHEDVLTEVLSKMLQRLEDKIEKDKLLPEHYDEFLTLLRECVALIKSKKSQKDGISERFDDELTGLLHRARSADLRSMFAELVRRFLQAIYGVHPDVRGVTLVIPIDDVDLNIKRAYIVAEEMRKYLAVPRVVVLAALKPEQLRWVVEQQFISESKDIYTSNLKFDKHVIWEMSVKYMDKFLPDRRRMYLTSLAVVDENVNFEYRDADGTLLVESSGSDSYRKAVCDYVYQKTGVRFSHTETRTSSIVPQNMRELVEFMGFLHSMEDIVKWDKSGGRDLIDNKTWLENLQRLEYYLINSYAPRHLRVVDLETIKSITNAPVLEKREIALRDLIKVFDNSGLESLRPDLDAVLANKTEHSIWDIVGTAAHFESVFYADYVYCLSFVICTLFSIDVLRLLIQNSDNLKSNVLISIKTFISAPDPYVLFFKTYFTEDATFILTTWFEEAWGHRLPKNVTPDLMSDNTLLLCNANFIMEFFRRLRKGVGLLNLFPNDVDTFIINIRDIVKDITESFGLTLTSNSYLADMFDNNVIRVIKRRFRERKSSLPNLGFDDDKPI
jgi:hypothetical protein